MIRSSRTLATQYLLGILLYSSLFWRRAGGAVIKGTLFLHRNSDDVEGSEHEQSPNDLTRISVYITVLATGFVLAAITAFLFLVLAALIETFSRRDPRSKGERTRRGRIPKLVLDRLIQTEQNYGDFDEEPERNEGERTGNELESRRLGKVDHEKSNNPNAGASATDKNLSKPLPSEPDISTSSIPNPTHLAIIPSPNRPAKEMGFSHTQEDYLRWIKSIYTIIQMTSAVQSYIQHTDSTGYKPSVDSNKDHQ